MTDDRMALAELLQKSGDGDFLRAVAEAVRQILMEADVEGLIGAGRHERTGDRLNYRNGYRELASTPAWDRFSCGSPSCARVRTSRPFWSRARLPRRRWSR
jgi:mutator family transposase